MIRVLIGMFVVIGSVGTLDVDPNASILVQGLVASIGALIAASGLPKLLPQ